MSAIDKVRRLLHLIERLQSGRTYNTKELADFCKVSRRTIFRDIKSLQDAGVPLLYDGPLQGYWIAMETGLPQVDLTLKETLGLIIIATEMARNTPFQDIGRSAALKLQSNLPTGLNNNISVYTATIAFPNELVDTSEQNSKFDLIQQAMVQTKKIRIQYKRCEIDSLRTLLSPYQLYFHGQTWFVIGRSSVHRTVRMFNLEFISDIELTTDEFSHPPRFSIKRFFKHAWRIYPEIGNRQEIHLRFDGSVGQNVASVMWHRSQKTRWRADGSLDFFVTVDGINEIALWIMQYGDQVEVIKPESLKKLIIQRANAVIALYS